MISEAIILAGGLGTRLRSAVPDLPKCLAHVNGKPFLSYLIDYHIKQGISHFIFSLGYKHGLIEVFLQEKFTDLIPEIKYSISLEDEPLGTGGAILKAAALSDAKDIVVMNGDTFFRVNLKSLGDFHHSLHAYCTLALKQMTDSDRYGVVELDENNKVASFKEKKWYPKSLINGGVYALNRERFIKENLPVKFSFEKEYLESFYQKRPIYGFVQDEYFIDIGIPEDFKRAQTELLQHL